MIIIHNNEKLKVAISIYRYSYPYYNTIWLKGNIIYGPEIKMALAIFYSVLSIINTIRTRLVVSVVVVTLLVI